MNRSFIHTFKIKLLLLTLFFICSVTHLFGQAPVIKTFSPLSGPVGTSVTITGTGFNAIAANDIVFFGATMAKVTTASTTSLTVTVPAGATYQPISVLNGTNGLSGSSIKPFIATFTPNHGEINPADFSSPITFDTGGGCVSIVIADFDGDGKPDLAMANKYNNTISVLRNTSAHGAVTGSSFAAKVDFAAGNGPSQIAAGDLDGDGKIDLVVTNTNSRTISVFRNTATAGAIDESSFAASIDFSTPYSPTAIAIADLDGDGKSDIAVSTNLTVSIFRNVSTINSININSFAPRVDLAEGAIGIAIGDVDGDGKPDLVLASNFGISVARNTSIAGELNNSSFDKPFLFRLDFGTYGVTLGDLDGDGKADLLATNIGSNSLTVLINTSVTGAITSGSFASPVNFDTGITPYVVVIGDLDGDGKPDIAVADANVYNPNENSAISVWRNLTAGGSFSTTSLSKRVDLNAGKLPTGLAICDLDGDGKADIALTNDITAATGGFVSVLHSNPVLQPTVQASNLVFSNTTTNSTTATWTIGNGASRVVFIAETTAGNPLLLNDTSYFANPVFSLGKQVGSSGWYCVYNGTGNTIPITGLSSGATYRVLALEYNGTAGSENYLTSVSTTNPANITTTPGGPVTINSINLVTASPAAASMIQYQVTFNSAITGLTANNFSLSVAGTINGSAITSVTGSGSNYTVTVNSGTGDGTIALSLNNSTGLTPGIINKLPFAGSTCIINKSSPGGNAAPSISSFSPASGPVGTNVLITGSGFNAIPSNNLVFFGATQATVKAASATSLTVTVPPGANYQPVSVLNSGTVLTGYASKPFMVTFTPNKGSITKADFTPAVGFNTGGSCTSMVINDLDGDGKPDLVLANSYNSTVSVLRNISKNGSIDASSFGPKIDFAVGAAPYFIAVGDLDGDGKPDIVVNSSHSLTILRNTSVSGSITANSFSSRTDLASMDNPSNIAINDLDGDGKPDLVVSYSSLPTGTASIWRNISSAGSISINSFAPRVDFGGTTPGSNQDETLAVGDIDGDGKPDIVIANNEVNLLTVYHNTTIKGVISEFGSFANPVLFNTGKSPFDVAIGDMDGDGKLDLVVTNNVDSTVSIFRNTSVPGAITTSSFAPKVDFFTHGYASKIGVGDLDGDGKPDLVLTDASNNQTSILRNTSASGIINSGSFAQVVGLTTGMGSYGIAVGDLDGDGKAEIAVTGGSPSNTAEVVYVFRNNPVFQPVIQATNIVFTNTATNSTTATWTNGGGESRAVFIAASASPGNPLPVNRMTYTANPVYTSGTQIGKTGWYCIYNGTGNTVDISGLSSGATYRVMVVEYNGTGGGEYYLTTPATGNPANITTVAGGPITINSINLVTASPTNASTIQYTVTFASPITGLTAGNFVLVTKGGITGASIASLSGSGATYSIIVNTGTGDGTIGLNLANANGLTPAVISLLPFVGPLCTIDKTAPVVTISKPSVSSILSGSGTVKYIVTYSDVNFNTSTLTSANITLNSTGSATGTISVTGPGITDTVTVSGITGSGSLGISIAAGTASDLAGNNAAASGPSETFLVAPVLSNLTISSGTLSPVFASNVQDYTAIVNNAASSIIVSPITTDPNVTVKVNGGSASTPVNLVVGLNNIVITVTTLDGVSSTTYTLGVVRAAPVVSGLPPNIAYGNGKIMVSSTRPFSITPTNTGGPVPKTNYGQVTTFAGSPAETAGYINGPGASAQFNWPQQAVMDVAGNLYVADAVNNSIRMITPAGVVSTFAGSITGAAGLQDGTGTGALFNYPDGIVVDNAGNFFVSDYASNAIRKITPTGVVTTFYSSGSAFGPGGLCFDGSGNLIVTAQDASQILKITPSGVASIIAGSAAGYVNGPVSVAQFNTPEDVKVDAAGNIYVVDFENNAIRKISTGGIVTTLAGSDVSGNSPGFEDGKGTAAKFNNPAGLSISPGGVIYVADFYNNDIRQIMPDSTVSLLAGSASQVPGDADGIGTGAGLSQPDYIFIDGTGTAYVSEFAANRIRKLVLTGYQLKGALPAGLAFDPTTGLISGSVEGPFTTQTDTITAYNAFGISSKVVTISYQQFSTIATLINLVPDAGTLSPSFATATNNYTDSVPNATSGITLTPTTTDSTATVTVNGATVLSGSASVSIPLKVGDNTITTIVTAQDGSTTDTYTVIVTRAPSAIATLDDLAVSEGTLTPAFTSGTNAYADTVATSVTSLTATMTTDDPYATITINGVAAVSGTASAPIPLLVGNNTITVIITAQDGVTTQTYAVTVYRGEATSDITATNVLTPNGDGKNDYWLIKDIELYPQNNVTVFDKAGRTVYTKCGYNNEWDGTFNGAPLAEGTYYFIVDLGPGLRKFKGFISILRN